MTQLGTTPTHTDCRDAIHVAVVPAICPVNINPGNYLKIADPDWAIDHQEDCLHVVPTDRYDSECIGIADPFHTDPNGIIQEHRFWLLLKPGTANNLRHHFDHPDLPGFSIDPDDPDDGCRGC